MKPFLAFVGMTIGSYVGWYLGEPIGFVTACFLSIVGTGVGLYAGRILWQRYEEYLG